MFVIAIVCVSIPLIAMAAVGLTYILHNKQLKYHTEVSKTIGEAALVRELNKLAYVSALTPVALSIVLAILRYEYDLWSNLSLWGGLLVVIVVCFTQNRACGIALARTTSGIALVGMCLVLANTLVQEPRSITVVALVETCAIAYTAIETRKLGIRAGVKTPWSVAMALAIVSAVGGLCSVIADLAS